MAKKGKKQAKSRQSLAKRMEERDWRLCQDFAAIAASLGPLHMHARRILGAYGATTLHQEFVTTSQMNRWFSLQKRSWRN